ncbi:transposable element Tc3 transposase [Trichonephila clavipes]|nr:transposable element Tc3 transposase [Trichonephila clavipes]
MRAHSLLIKIELPKEDQFPKRLVISIVLNQVGSFSTYPQTSYSRLNNAFKLCNFISKIMVDFHRRILLSDEAHFWLNGYVNKQNCRIWSEANPQVYVETPLHPGKLTVWCALWAGGILLQKR